MKGTCPYCNKNRMKLFEEISNKAIKLAKEFTKRSHMAPSRDEIKESIYLSGASDILTEYIWQKHEEECKIRKILKEFESC